jgi:hypothetical protein
MREVSHSHKHEMSWGKLRDTNITQAQLIIALQHKTAVKAEKHMRVGHLSSRCRSFRRVSSALEVNFC